MRKAFSIVTSLLVSLFAATHTSQADSTWELSVQVSAAVQSSPAQVTLSWPQDTYSQPNSYTIFRKAPGATSWGSGTTLPGTSVSYVDQTVTPGTAYEYQIVKSAPSYTGYGYIVAGINLPLVENRGRVLLVVDNTYASQLSSELSRLQQDLVGDGWTVTRLDVSRNDTPANVKNLIRAQYNADPANTKAVFLFGHVPVPYSGSIVPDGHAPEHQGAWPSDGYYGDMTGTWTDNSVNVTGGSDARTRNVPGDGKFDQSTFPAPINLMVGRVDLANMPGRLTWGGPATFPSELELLRNYLNKDHKFRHKQINLPRRAVVGDYFGYRDGEAFAASGWRNFSTFVGANNVLNLPNKGTWIPHLKANEYLWAYGCGAGSYTSIGGLGNTGQYQDGVTPEMYQNDVKAAFTLLFGSWLGDWDSEDNILRSVLALPSYGLTCGWSGRPHWFLQHMAVGEPIGFGVRLTQNNTSGLYRNQQNNCAGQIHTALMGDPTLRMHMVAPVSNLRGQSSGNSMTLAWNAPAEAIAGYHVYRAATAAGPYTRLTSSPISATTYTDASAAAGQSYMVRAIKLETGSSGSYQNASQGVFLTPTGADYNSGTSTNGTNTVPNNGDNTGSTGSTPNTGTTNLIPSTSTGTTPIANSVVYVDDSLPNGAVTGTTGGDTWSWVTASPAPFAGTKSHQSTLSVGLHEHYFSWATQTLSVGAGDVLFAYVYLDPSNPPTEIMVQWFDGSWDHRAYWGANQISYGVDGTPGRRYMGTLPANGQWIQLRVPASQVGLEGRAVTGMAFSQVNGRATWDYAGKAPAASFTDSGSGTTTPNSGTNTVSSANSVIWVDDVLPAGGQPGADGGDSWTWVNNNPAPVSGSMAHQSALATGLHQHYFSFATKTLTITPGEILFAYVYLDPANPPSQVMLQWHDGTWEHRAYWGANRINYGIDGTVNRRRMGALPAAGQWVRLEVPASAVDLEGSTLTGMAFSAFDGRVTWDAAGKASAFSTNQPPTTTPTNSVPDVTNSVPGASVLTNLFVWVNDSLPAGAQSSAEGGDTWNWVSANPAPYAGTKFTQSSLSAGLHQHYFMNATATMQVNTGDILFTHVYLDPANPPSQIMVQWTDGSWDHRAYWGANRINYGTDGTAGRRYMGALPTPGQWVRLEIPASKVDLEGRIVKGMAFSQFDGRASWDYSGKGTLTANSGSGDTPTQTNSPPNSQSWVDDALPAGAQAGTEGGDVWNWVSSNPAPVSGSKSHQSTAGVGMHQHFFAWATDTLTVNAGDVLFAHIYIDPSSVPSEVMLQWFDGTWEHRAYWGANRINYGVGGTGGRRYMGPLPAAGQWVRLQVPASQVDLEGRTVTGMAFTLVDGRATWDNAGKSGGVVTDNPGTNNPPVTDPGNTNVVTNPGGGSYTNNPTQSTNSLPGTSLADYVNLEAPTAGANTLHILTPNLLELKLINSKPSQSAPVSQWDLVDGSAQFRAPPASAFTVLLNGQPVGVSAIGFKRRPIWAPIAAFDLRLENGLYLQLATSVSEGQTVEVKNPDGTLWSADMKFQAKADPLRFNPGIHVNQEGYMPGFQKKAMVGYYAGNLGEVNVPNSGGFKLVDASSGATVFQGSLTARRDVGYTYSPTPYQKVYEADFTSFNTPGEYRLVVPGMGGSLPFMIDSGVAMGFARTYALGLYHQRCGASTDKPWTSHNHGKCHMALAEVPTTSGAYPFAWTTIANYANTINQNNPPQSAPALTSPAAQLFPFVKQGPLDVSGGHHDAGDYSKYTINSASLVHYLMFSADALAGVNSLDNLGIPESGDGISDVLQEAKWEADFLAKLQDSDGGFYFLVYPKNREYEGDVTPDRGDPQIVYPKTISVTAASVAALAQCASSPKFKQAYPQAAAMYLEKAKLGWQFIQNAVAKYGKNGAYQKITHYGDDFADNDELAWAAAEMFIATGDANIHQQLMSWFDPANPATWRWGWWHMSQAYGHAIRSYAFAVRTGRLTAGQLNATYLAKCEAEIIKAAEDCHRFSQQNAYGSSFPESTKAVKAAGWHFSADQAFDLAVGQQVSPKPEYINSIIANMNYEGGCNPVNVSYVTGLGWKRQRDVVNQWAVNDSRIMPPPGQPIGNITANYGYLWNYGSTLNSLSFPADGAATAPYPFYDRWTDGWNVNAEFVVLNSARSLGALTYLAGQTALKSQAWKGVTGARVIVPTSVVPVGQPVTLTMEVPGMDLAGARIVWEARDQEPAFGASYTIAPKNNGTQWVEAEAQWPDGRRVFASGSFMVNSPNVVWADDALPAGATGGAEGGDSWNWVTSPTPQSGTKAHKSALVAGAHQHYFDGATATLTVGSGDVLYAWVYLDPANPPSQIMLQWNNGSWDHRAYWGSNQLGYGQDGTASRRYMGPLPATGQWVQLKVPASQVGLEGSVVRGMAFTLYNGTATWDAAGRLSPSSTPTASVRVDSLKVSGEGAMLTWTSTSNSNYQIVYKNDLKDADWTLGAQLKANTSTSSWLDRGARQAAQRFYVVACVE